MEAPATRHLQCAARLARLARLTTNISTKDPIKEREPNGVCLRLNQLSASSPSTCATPSLAAECVGVCASKLKVLTEWGAAGRKENVDGLEFCECGSTVERLNEVGIGKRMAQFASGGAVKPHFRVRANPVGSGAKSVK